MAEWISSRKNEQVKAAAKLGQSASFRRQTGLFLAEGARLCADAFASRMRIRQLFCTEHAAKKYESYLAPILQAVPSFFITEPVAELLSQTDGSQGIFCVCEQREALSREAFPLRHSLALETVQDPGNLGAALRTAEALGLGSVLLAGSCCDVYSPKVLRASMGAVFRLPIFFSRELPDALDALRGRGFFSCAAVPDSTARPVTELDFSRPCIMAVGNEGNGLTEAAAAACDLRVTIPMLGRAESLNAASSAAILMWEMMRSGGVSGGG